MNAASGAPWTLRNGTLTLTVRLTPKGGRDAVEGVATLADGREVLKARVRAAPKEGEANDALVRLIAKMVGVAPRDVAVIAGGGARIKTLRIAGAGPSLIVVLEKLRASG